jgi:hypothetical protein
MFAFRAPNFEPVKHIKKPLPVAHSPISVLNDDVLLHIFYIHRLHIKDEDNTDSVGYPLCYRQRWWYKLVHVSRRWRSLILAAPSLLDLHLVCSSGVPVADMLAHSPPLPLTIFYWLDKYAKMKAEDEKDALLALSQRDRVRRIALRALNEQLEKLFVAMDGEFPILERLNVVSSNPPEVILPRTFGAPNLSNVKLLRVALPNQPHLLTPTGLVSLQLREIQDSALYPPSYILASLSLMPQLETLWIMFKEYLPPSGYARDTAITSHVTLSNLREFVFLGDKAHLEDLCTWMAAPVLSIFHVQFFHLHTFTAPHLLSFMQTSVTFRFHAIKLTCSRRLDLIHLQGDPQPSGLDPFSLKVKTYYLACPVSIQVLDALSPVLSVAVQVTLIMNISLPNCYLCRTEWRGFLRPFSDVKVLRVVTDVGGLGHSLRTEEGEQPLDLLPNLEEVIYSGSDKNAFTPFINEREAVGHPVRMKKGSMTFVRESLAASGIPVMMIAGFAVVREFRQQGRPP